ncbi:hypothetical protein AKJ09_10225 [Labilithrix luteola]|uniref:Uncharacterized protein n=1 Tax=Labilithrix luteola TaxID=1391654 RepID=A0A0K1QD22_9BACT|nr:hypothetical protein [Labilithrix luteola]AKV03562.1 hypothetical protein AKJ09_10225 [Labilithrix luteola]
MTSPDRQRVAEPCCRRTIFVAFRRAAIQVWGEAGLQEIGKLLPEDARGATIDDVVIVGEWLPERYVMSWYEAAMGGPAKGDRAAFCTFIDRMMDAGFGTVRKLLLQLASPEVVVGQAPDLWRHDHTHGHLTTKMLDPQTVLFVLKDHVYTTSLVGRLAVTEIYRYALQLTRVKNVTARHVLSGDELHVTVKLTR